MNRKSLLTFLFVASVVVQPSLCSAQVELRSGYAGQLATCCVVTADFNRDGVVDLAVGAFEGSFGVQVFLGRGDGTFGPPVAYAPGSGANALATADLNHDGNPDIVIANVTGDSVTVLLGNGDGTFQAPVEYSTPSLPVSVVLGDFNSDGKLDIAAAIQGDYYSSCFCVAVLPGNGDGSFREPAIITYLPSGAGPLALTAGHFNGDGDLDLALTENFTSSSAAQILLGNGDGIPDLVSAPTVIADNLFYSAVYIFPGKGDGTFGSPEISYPAAYNSSPQGLALADFNGDHKLDLTFADEDGFSEHNGDSEYVLLNTGTVKFSPIDLLDFTNQKRGTTSPPQTVTLTNEGKATLSISSIKTTGEFGATSTCGKGVAAKASCTISVTFSPKGAGEFSGTVQINDSASSKPQVIALSGRGY